jgi:energy-coupling factor transporter ATP-binding protein EcfA2
VDPQLEAIVLSRLEAEQAGRTDWAALILGALEGDDALEALVDGRQRPSPAGEETRPAAPRPAGAYLGAITVEGFRGIGPAVTLELPAGPGLTLVVGRNGSGKSSFAEALEVVLTGDTFRWQARSTVWREAWRNLHHPVAHVGARFLLEGERGPCVVSRRWARGARLEDAVTEVQVHGKPKTTLDELGWSAALQAHRPLLSYDELGALLDERPSALFDAMASMLGLDDLVTAQRALQEARLSRERKRREVLGSRDRLLGRLRGIDDERARLAVAVVDGEDWDLDRLEQVVTGGEFGDDADGGLATLRRLATLDLPNLDHSARTVRELREASAALRASAGTAASRARQAAELLELALRYHAEHGDEDCPVCGSRGALDGRWRESHRGAVERLRQAAEAADAAHRRVETARERAAGLVTPPGRDLLARGAAAGLDVAGLIEALEVWEQGRTVEDLEALAAHIEATVGPLSAALAGMSAAAKAELDRREDAWRPVAAELAAWLAPGREAARAREVIPLLASAEKWLKQAAAEIRRERFLPVAEKARGVWELLRQQSHVALDQVVLAGEGSRRRVELDVTVDGVGAAALGVMSQGELHSLALSLFIPRATLPESPFRFLVIDDPVQSMDPARVDGLARALEMVAKERQVVVLTHDDRLPEAVRRLEIAATVIEVTRRDRSVVELRPVLDPVTRYLDDAFALAKTDELPAVVAERVILGFCRLALEAACATVVRRRRLGRGEPHAEVESLLESAGRLTVLAALALFDDRDRHGDVMGRLNREHGARAADAFRQCNEGAHGLPPDALMPFVRTVEELTKRVLALK